MMMCVQVQVSYLSSEILHFDLLMFHSGSRTEKVSNEKLMVGRMGNSGRFFFHLRLILQ